MTTPTGKITSIQNIKNPTSMYAGYGGGSKPTGPKVTDTKKKVERKGEVAELQKYY